MIKLKIDIYTKLHGLINSKLAYREGRYIANYIPIPKPLKEYTRKIIIKTIDGDGGIDTLDYVGKTFTKEMICFTDKQKKKLKRVFNSTQLRKNPDPYIIEARIQGQRIPLRASEFIQL